MSGDKDSARNAYADFIGIWKNADPNIPILKQAKAEYARQILEHVPVRSAAGTTSQKTTKSAALGQQG